MTDIVPSSEDDRDAAIAAQPVDEATLDRRQKVRPTTLAEAAAVMLVSGSTYEEISDILELEGPEHAKRISIRALASQFDGHDKEALRRIVLGMYRQLFGSALRRSENPRYTSREAAANNALRAASEMVKVLGLEAPKQLEIHTPTMTEIELTLREVADLVSRALPEEADVIDGHVISDEEAS